MSIETSELKKRTSNRFGVVGAALLLALSSLAATGVAVLGSAAPAGAISSSLIYVSNSESRSFSSFDLGVGGDIAPVVSNSSLSLVAPYGQAFDASGNLWVSNYDGSSVDEFSAAELSRSDSPAPAVVIGSDGTSLDGPVGLAFNRAGDLWVANYGGESLNEFTPTQLAATGDPTPHVTIGTDSNALDLPEELAFDGAGNLWSGSTQSNQIQAYSPAQLATNGSPNPAVVITSPSLIDPVGIIFDNNGNAWVNSYNNSELLKFTPAQLTSSGSRTPSVIVGDDGSGTSISGAYQMEFDSTGSLWLANSSSDSVSGYSPSQLAVSGSPAPAHKIVGAASDFDAPAGLAIADPPQPPSALVATASQSSGGTVVTMSWTAPLTRVAATDYQLTPIENGVELPTIDTHSTATSYSMTAPTGSSFAFIISASNVFGQGPPTVSRAVSTGYREVASDGGLFSFGSVPFYGSTGAMRLNKPIVGMASAPTGHGYWLVASDGGIFSYGDAVFYGSTGGIPLNKPIVGMATTADGHGYWLVASDGGIFAFGDAAFHGSTGGSPLNKPIVGMASTPSGRGYWLVASDGGIFSYGDASFHGSTGAITLNKPIVGMAPARDGQGYWMVASDGGIFAFGDAAFLGSMGGQPLNKPIAGMLSTPSGHGYWLVASDGGLFSFGDASFLGSMGGLPLNQPIVGMS